MNQQEKLKALVEASGECAHVWEEDSAEWGMLECIKCGAFMADCTAEKLYRASPEDLTELTRLSEILGFEIRLETKRPDWSEIAYQVSVRKFGKKVWGIYAQESSPAEALLNALYQAVKEKKP